MNRIIFLISLIFAINNLDAAEAEKFIFINNLKTVGKVRKPQDDEFTIQFSVDLENGNTFNCTYFKSYKKTEIGSYMAFEWDRKKQFKKDFSGRLPQEFYNSLSTLYKKQEESK